MYEQVLDPVGGSLFARVVLPSTAVLSWMVV